MVEPKDAGKSCVDATCFWCWPPTIDDSLLSTFNSLFSLGEGYIYYPHILVRRVQCSLSIQISSVSGLGLGIVACLVLPGLNDWLIGGGWVKLCYVA